MQYLILILLLLLSSIIIIIMMDVEVKSKIPQRHEHLIWMQNNHSLQASKFVLPKSSIKLTHALNKHTVEEQEQLELMAYGDILHTPACIL